MLGLTVSVVVLGDSPGFAMGLHCYISLGHLTQFILIAGLLYTYMKVSSPATAATGHKDAAPT
jgi:hypothetical protein